MEIKKLNDVLLTYNVITRMEYVSDLLDHWESILSITLSDVNDPLKTIEIICHDVSQLKLNKLGGGLCQFLGFHVENIGSLSLDRCVYKFSDSQSRRIEFCCKNFEVK